jgi:hypothetical protein
MGEGDLRGGECRGIDKGEGGREKEKRKIGEEINKRHRRKRGKTDACMYCMKEKRVVKKIK